MSIKISAYENVRDTSSHKLIDFDMLVDNIRDGIYYKSVSKIRAEPSKKKRSILKTQLLEGVTISGTFNKGGRSDKDLKEHSGLICLDIDSRPDVAELREELAHDPHVFCAFISCSGAGLAIVFKIPKDKHEYAYKSLSKYLYEKYNLQADPANGNVSRLRFVSHDPDIYYNPKAQAFKRISKPKVQKKYNCKVVVSADMNRIIEELELRKIDITDGYENWFTVGMSLARTFKENGEDYFHRISALSTQYDSEECSKKYQNFIESVEQSRDKEITIASFYHIIRSHGIKIQSEDTREIIKAVKSQKRQGISEDEIIRTLTEIGGHDIDLVDEIVPQVDANTTIEDISLVESIEIEMTHRYQFRRNVISRRIEFFRGEQWAELEEKNLNSIILSIKKDIEKAQDTVIKQVINSELTPDFNPILDFIESNEFHSEGHIQTLVETIDSSKGLQGADRLPFIKKWLVSIVASIYGDHSPLMLILVGSNQGTGKTEFFRRLLPDGLKPYFTDSNLDRKDGDLATMLSENILILNDELGGQTVKDVEKMKAILSRHEDKIRIAYGKHNERFKRLAVLCGTTNNEGVLNDPTGNRRLIPIHVHDIDHEAYNAIDKTHLFMEMVQLYKDGFDYKLTKEEVHKLNALSDDFKAVSPEEDLFFKYFKIPEFEGNGDWFTSTDISVYIEQRTRQKLSLKKIGSLLTSNGVLRKSFQRNNKIQKGFRLTATDGIIETSNEIPFEFQDEKSEPETYFEPETDELPF